MAALFKYQALTFLGVSVGMLVYGLLLGLQTRRRVGVAAALQVGGAVVPAILYLV